MALAFLLSALLAQVGAGEPLPADWRDALRQDGAAALNVAVRLAHTGLPPGADYEDLAREIAGQADPTVPALVAAAALAPARVSGRPAAGGAAAADAVARVLERLLQLPDTAELDVLDERVRAAVRGGDLEDVAAALESGRAANRRRAVSLLGTAPYPEARPVILRLALEPGPEAGGGAEQPGSGLSEEERGLLAERILMAEGRAGLAELQALLDPGTPDLLLRRLLAAAEPLLEPADMTALERIAMRAGGPAAGQALRLWASREEDPARRLRIFELASGADFLLRQAVLEALARRGPHEEIAGRLLAALDGTDEESCSMAIQLLPSFVGAERLAEEYRRRGEAASRPERRAQWVVEMARLPVASSRRAAAAWLAEGGWSCGAPAVSVALALRESPEVDPWLDGLLRQDGAPPEVLLPLALGRAPFHGGARAFLRQVVSSAPALRRREVLRALATDPAPEDLRLLLDLARDPSFSAPARAEAVSALGTVPAAASLLLELLEPPVEEYEVAEAVVRALASSGEAELRRAGLRAAAGGFHRQEAEERQGLRLAAWQEQASRPLAAEAGDLAAALVAELRACSGRPGPRPSAPLPDPRALAADYPEVDACARALAAALGAGGRLDGSAGGRELEALDPGTLPPGPLLLAAALLSDAAGDLAGQWAAAVAAMPGVHRGTRVRAQATAARRAWVQPDGAAEAALATLLERPEDLLGHPWDLAAGVARPGARAWVLPVDRLVERRILVQASRTTGPSRLGLLSPLEEGAALPAVLAEAADLALAAPGGTGLAVRLAARAVALAPHEPRARLALARVSLAAGDLAAARQELAAVGWLAAEGSDLRRVAEDELRRLAAAPR